jgi:hypothetical protein
LKSKIAVTLACPVPDNGHSVRDQESERLEVILYHDAIVTPPAAKADKIIKTLESTQFLARGIAAALPLTALLGRERSDNAVCMKT